MNRRLPPVDVPVPLLLELGLTPADKLIWMASQLSTPGGAGGPAVLERDSGVTRKTVLKGMAHLTGAGWFAAGVDGALIAVDLAPSAPRVRIPALLLSDRLLKPTAKLMYGMLQTTPGFRSRTGQTAYIALKGLTRLSLNTVKQDIHDLVAAGWLRLEQQHQLAPIRFTLVHPDRARG